MFLEDSSRDISVNQKHKRENLPLRDSSNAILIGVIERVREFFRGNIKSNPDESRVTNVYSNDYPQFLEFLDLSNKYALVANESNNSLLMQQVSTLNKCISLKQYQSLTSDDHNKNPQDDILNLDWVKLKNYVGMESLQEALRLSYKTQEPIASIPQEYYSDDQKKIGYCDENAIASSYENLSLINHDFKNTLYSKKRVLHVNDKDIPQRERTRLLLLLNDPYSDLLLNENFTEQESVCIFLPRFLHPKSIARFPELQKKLLNLVNQIRNYLANSEDLSIKASLGNSIKQLIGNLDLHLDTLLPECDNMSIRGLFKMILKDYFTDKEIKIYCYLRDPKWSPINDYFFGRLFNSAGAHDYRTPHVEIAKAAKELITAPYPHEVLHRCSEEIMQKYFGKNYQILFDNSVSDLFHRFADCLQDFNLISTSQEYQTMFESFEHRNKHRIENRISAIDLYDSNGNKKSEKELAGEIKILSDLAPSVLLISNLTRFGEIPGCTDEIEFAKFIDHLKSELHIIEFDIGDPVIVNGKKTEVIDKDYQMKNEKDDRILYQVEGMEEWLSGKELSWDESKPFSCGDIVFVINNGKIEKNPTLLVGQTKNDIGEIEYSIVGVDKKLKKENLLKLFKYEKYVFIIADISQHIYIDKNSPFSINADAVIGGARKDLCVGDAAFLSISPEATAFLNSIGKPFSEKGSTITYVNIYAMCQAIKELNETIDYQRIEGNIGDNKRKAIRDCHKERHDMLINYILECIKKLEKRLMVYFETEHPELKSIIGESLNDIFCLSSAIPRMGGQYEVRSKKRLTVRSEIIEIDKLRDMLKVKYGIEMACFHQPDIDKRGGDINQHLYMRIAPFYRTKKKHVNELFEAIFEIIKDHLLDKYVKV